MTNLHDALIVALVAGLAGVLCTMATRIIWDWLKSRKEKIPRAGNGFLTLNDLQSHCEKNQKACVKEVISELKVLRIELESQLSRGEDTFTEINRVLKKHEDLLQAHTLILREIRIEYGQNHASKSEAFERPGTFDPDH